MQDQPFAISSDEGSESDPAEAPGPVAVDRVGSMNVTVVATLEEFQAAFQKGTDHIEVQAHIDLTATENSLRTAEFNTDLSLGRALTNVNSLSVRFS